MAEGIEDSIEVCPGCHIPSAPDDQVIDVVWYGCDFCPRWWHRHCLSGNILVNADRSVQDDSVKFRCPGCPEQPVCAACLLDVSNLAAPQCHNCLAQYHFTCLPEQHQINYSVVINQGRQWNCGRCQSEEE